MGSGRCDKKFIRSEADISNAGGEHQRKKLNKEFLSDKEGIKKLRNFVLRELVCDIRL
jgi:hypothetical protein